jgi:hypothetical protein
MQQKLLEADLFSLEAQLRNFQPIRERLNAIGKDATAFYTQLQARRAKLVAGLTPPPVSKPDLRTLGIAMQGSLLERPLTAAHFNPATGIFGFGTNGVVQVPPAMEGVQDKVGGKYPMTGNINTIVGTPPGLVEFEGVCAVGPPEIAADQYDPTINYFWIHNWKYLIPFPAPSVASFFTYRFNVSASFSVFSGGVGNVMAFFSLGETANLTTDTDIAVGIAGGFPINADLSQPAPLYNGHYGELDGELTVQRTFLVGAGHVPGVAIVVGAIVALPMQEEVRLTFFNDFSGISIFSNINNGSSNLITYSYEPQLVFHQ